MHTGCWWDNLKQKKNYKNLHTGRRINIKMDHKQKDGFIWLKKRDKWNTLCTQ